MFAKAFRVSETTRYIFSLLPLLLLTFIGKVYSQQFSVSGKVSTNLGPVSRASVTFVDQSNTSRKYSTITDEYGNYQISIITRIEEKPTIPKSFELGQNHPNPFSSKTIIPYKLNKQSDVTVQIYNILGQQARSFRIGTQPNGIYGLVWDGKNNFGMKVAAGIYLYRLITRTESITKKIVFMNDTNPVSVHFNGNISFPSENLKKEEKTQIDPVKYTVRITNTDSTQPKILTHEFYNVILNVDTTLNFAVNMETHYNMNLYIGNWGFDQVYIVDTDSDTVIDTLTGFRSVGNVTTTKSGNKLYVTTTAYSVYPYDTTYPAAVYSVDLITKVKKEI